MSDEILKKRYGNWALLAGAAEGLGEAFTFTLARRGMNIVMVDNQPGPLKALAKKVEEEFGIKTITQYLDLAQADAAREIMHILRGIDCRLMIYNAAFSRVKPFLESTEEELDLYMDTNARTPLKLVHAFAAYLQQHSRAGGIMLMSSLAGLIGMQLVAPYAATKAFTWNLVEALHHELKSLHIDIMACIAGATATPAYLATKPHYGLFKPSVMKPEMVAEEALSRFGRKTLYIPGLLNRWSYFFLTRLLPRKVASAIANRTMKRMYRFNVK
jgi:hypothetical protein